MPKYILFPLATVYTLLLVMVTFMDPSGVPKLTFSHYDKLYHVFAYAILGVVWISFTRFQKQYKSVYITAFGLVGFGILLEFFQHQVNPLRQFETLDIVANTVGIIIGTVIALKQNIITFN